MESRQQLLQINKFASQALSARSNAPSSSGPLEFTKRKNWSQNVLQGLRDVVHVLSQDLNILYCSPASQEFLGYQPGELMGRSFTEFMHVDDVNIFNHEFRTAQSNSSVLRVVYRFMRKDGKYTMLETRGHFFKSAFFGSARSVPTETTRMMDTFLDYKMENEILKQKVQAAKGRAASKNNETQEPSPAATNTPLDEEDFEELFAQSENVYTQGVLSSYNVNESVSLFTGLHFDLGERSRGISMGLKGELFNTLVAPSIGDEGANETVDKLKSGKKRRNEDDSDHMCTDCGTLDASE